MTRRTRRAVALLLVVALAGLFVLSLSLTDLPLQPGGPFPGGGPGAATAAGTSDVPSQPGSAVIIEAALGVIAVTLLVFVPRRVLGLLSTRNAFWLLLGLTLLIVFLAILPRIILGPGVLAAEEASGAGTAAPLAHPVSPLGQPPRAFAWVAVGAILLVAALAAFIVLRDTSRAGSPSQAIAGQAAQALDELSVGQDFHDVIIRCYVEVMQILRSAQQLERQQGMSAREYQAWLASQGVPAKPIQQLTSLFEKVRYGNEQAGVQEEEAAKECLQEIVRVCGKGVDR